MNRKHTLLALGALAIAGSAVAVSAHFVRGPNAFLNGTSVNVTWKEAGLGSNQPVEYRADAVGSAVYACRNHGQICPNAANKVSVTSNVSTFGALSSGKNGTVTGTLTIDLPTTSLSCPNGQEVVLTEASFSNIRLSDLTNGLLDVSTTPSSLSFSGPCP
jgi:hypothetical protein